MKELIIIGARGFGREVYSLAKRSIGYNETFIIKGFLDDNDNALDTFDNYPAILGAVESYEIKANDVFICALGSVEWKKHYVNLVKSKGGEFISLIEQNVILNQNSTIGNGCIVCGPSIISNDAIIKDFVTIHSNTILGHDVQIGNWSLIGAYCFFGGFTIVEEEVSVYVKATILDRLRIGKGATIGAASLVIKNVKPATTVFGNPAKVLDF